jgi:hypothetical protein
MKLEKIQVIIDNICQNNIASENDIGILFVFLRPQFSKDIILLDISNFITHSEGRTRGASFEHIYSFVKSLISTSKNGGSILGLSPIFIGDDVINRLAVVLIRIGIIFDRQVLLTRKDLIIDNLQRLMKGTEFVFDEPEVVKCFTQRDGDKMYFCINPMVNTALIKMHPGMTIRGRLFE